MDVETLLAEHPDVVGVSRRSVALLNLLPDYRIELRGGGMAYVTRVPFAWTKDLLGVGIRDGGYPWLILVANAGVESTRRTIDAEVRLAMAFWEERRARSE